MTRPDLSRTRNDLGSASSLPLPCVHFDENADENDASRDHFVMVGEPRPSERRQTTAAWLVRPDSLGHLECVCLFNWLVFWFCIWFLIFVFGCGFFPSSFFISSNLLFSFVFLVFFTSSLSFSLSFSLTFSSSPILLIFTFYSLLHPPSSPYLLLSHHSPLLLRSHQMSPFPSLCHQVFRSGLLRF